MHMQTHKMIYWWDEPLLAVVFFFAQCLYFCKHCLSCLPSVWHFFFHCETVHACERHAHTAGSNLPGIASQFANQILGTANQLRIAERKSVNQKIICEAVQSMHRTRFAVACALTIASTISCSRKLLVSPRRSRRRSLTRIERARRACSRGVIGSTMGAYPRGTGSNPVEGNGHFFPSCRQLYLSTLSDTHTHTHTARTHTCTHQFEIQYSIMLVNRLHTIKQECCYKTIKREKQRAPMKQTKKTNVEFNQHQQVKNVEM